MSNSSTISARVKPSAITPANINYVLAGMDPGDDLRFSPEVGGGITVSIHTKGEQVSRLQHRLNFVLDPEPVHRTWLSFVDDLPDKVYRHKSGEKAKREKYRISSLLKQAFSLALFFKTLDDAIEKISGTELLYKFQVGEYLVYANENMTGVMYSENGGETIYI
jgi:hypothetical protein